ncbi:hypothetical protein MHYP_G00198370 [Metynnis hypsauchen]
MTARLEELPPPRGGRAARGGLLKAADGTAACPARCLIPKPPHPQIRRGARATSSRANERAFISLIRSVNSADRPSPRTNERLRERARLAADSFRAGGKQLPSDARVYKHVNALRATSVGRESAESRGAAELLREHEDGRNKDQRVTGGGALMTLWNGGIPFIPHCATAQLISKADTASSMQVTLQEKLFCSLFIHHSARLTAEESRRASPDC